jgi:mRNA interferase MazF
MKRSDIVTVALPGDIGKPRPAAVVQSNLFNPTHSSFIVLPITSAIEAAPLIRITIDPTPENGLRAVSQIMIDKPTTIRRERIGRVIGRLPDDIMLRINRALIVWMGLA